MMPDDEFPFLGVLKAVQDETLDAGTDQIRDAKYHLAPWIILSHFLWDDDRRGKTVPQERAQPLLELMPGSVSSIYLAAAGYYRQAVAELRSLVDLVLWEWQFVSFGPSEPERHRALRVDTDFDPVADVPRLDHARLLTLPEVDRYREFMTRKAAETNYLEHLMFPVDIEAVARFRKALGRFVHAHPRTWNVVQAKMSPFPTFSADALTGVSPMCEGVVARPSRTRVLGGRYVVIVYLWPWLQVLGTRWCIGSGRRDGWWPLSSPAASRG